jgi:hypothetical protein
MARGLDIAISARVPACRSIKPSQMHRFAPEISRLAIHRAALDPAPRLLYGCFECRNVRMGAGAVFGGEACV